MTIAVKPLHWTLHDGQFPGYPEWLGGDPVYCGDTLTRLFYHVRDMAAWNRDCPPEQRYSLRSHLSNTQSDHATVEAAKAAAEVEWQAFVRAVIQS